MLCFLNGFYDRDEKNTSSSQRNIRFRLLRKSRASLKLLSTSSPAVTAQLPLAPPSPRPVKEEKIPTTSKSRQKKFHRHFPSVENDEMVLNYYSCALIGDILLQGHLYITKNFFAFYSNVFGYVTKLLIPMPSVTNITKEKTARFIPNAVGISTADEKHVFGSLMSRDSTFKYMVKIWEISQSELKIEAEALVDPVVAEVAASESDSSGMRDLESDKESTATQEIHSIKLTNLKTKLNGEIQNKSKDHPLSSSFRHKLLQRYKSFLDLPTHTLVMCAATFLLVLLFLSATLLIYRINRIHHKYVSLIEDHNLASEDDDVYSELLRYSLNLHSKTASSMHKFVDTQLQRIVKARRDLEALSSLLMPKELTINAKAKKQEASKADDS